MFYDNIQNFLFATLKSSVILILMLTAVSVRSLAQETSSEQALLSRAYTLSWSDRQEEAQRDFLRVLQTNPKHADALVGLGYSYAWSGKYSRAEKVFTQALKINPESLDAKKGLAYTVFWHGDYQEAERRVTAFLQEFPEDAEMKAILKKVQIARGKQVRAQTLPNRTLQKHPDRQGNISAVEAVRNLPPRFEISVWGGNTSFSNKSRLGLRLAEAAVWPVRNVRLWARFDNALSLDNLGLIRGGGSVTTYFLGGFVNWAKKLTSRLEIGKRELPGNIDQTLYQFEQVLYLPRSFSVKAGGFWGPRQDNLDEWLLYGGLTIPVTKNFRLEPTYFYSKITKTDDEEHRFLLSGVLKTVKNIELTPGVFFGQANSALTSGPETIYGGYILLSAPVLSHKGFFLFRFEAPAGDNFSVLAFGLNLALLK